MTDKEIYIDGVDVTGCEWFGQFDLDINVICTSNSPKKCSAYCKDNPNCYYKQLIRKEQNLQEAMDTSIKEFNRAEELKTLLKRKEQKCEELNKQVEILNEKYSQSVRDLISGKYCNTEKCQQLAQLKEDSLEVIGNIYEEES